MSGAYVSLNIIIIMEQFNHYMSDAISNWPGNMSYLNLLGWSEGSGHVHEYCRGAFEGTKCLALIHGPYYIAGYLAS